MDFFDCFKEVLKGVIRVYSAYVFQKAFLDKKKTTRRRRKQGGPHKK